MEDDLNFFSNGRQPHFFLLQMEDNLNFVLQMEDDLNFLLQMENNLHFLFIGKLIITNFNLPTVRTHFEAIWHSV